MSRVLVLITLLGAALALPQQRISGGEPTDIQQYPYMSNVQSLFFIVWQQTCGGALITSRTILSAANCFYYSYEYPEEWRVRLGSSNALNGGSLHEVSSIHLHEDYDHLTKEYDVAIMTLATPAVFSESVGVARIAGGSYELPVGTSVDAIGWGFLWFKTNKGQNSDESTESRPEHFHRVDLELFDQEECATRYKQLNAEPGYGYLSEVTDVMICAKGRDGTIKNQCISDNGSPMIHGGDVVVGIYSWGTDCSGGYYPGVSTKVAKVADWIVETGST